MITESSNQALFDLNLLLIKISGLVPTNEHL